MPSVVGMHVPTLRSLKRAGNIVWCSITFWSFTSAWHGQNIFTNTQESRVPLQHLTTPRLQPGGGAPSDLQGAVGKCAKVHGTEARRILHPQTRMIRAVHEVPRVPPWLEHVCLLPAKAPKPSLGTASDSSLATRAPSGRHPPPMERPPSPHSLCRTLGLTLSPG